MSPDESLVPIYDSLVSEVEFLVGRDVVEVRLEPAGGARIVFEVGDKPAPALYADVGPSTYEDESGSPHPLSEMVGAIVSNTSTEDGTLLLAFADGRRLRCEPHPRYGRGRWSGQRRNTRSSVHRVVSWRFGTRRMFRLLQRPKRSSIP